MKECSPIATEGVHGHKGVLHEDIVLESEFEGERVKFLTFLEKRETSTGFEKERERMVVRQKLKTSSHEIVKRDGLLRGRAMRVGFEHEIPGEDIRGLDLKEKGTRELEIIMGVRKRKRGK